MNFYSEGAVDDPAKVAQGVCRVFGVDHVMTIEQVLDPLAEPPSPEPLIPISSADLIDLDTIKKTCFMTSVPGYELLGRDVPVERLGDYLDRPGCFTLHMPPCAIQTEISQGVQRGIPPEIAGRTAVWPCGLTIGARLMWSRNAEREIVFLARPTINIDFSTNSEWPMDLSNYEALVARVPEVQAFKRRLEEVCGPLKEYVNWQRRI